MANQRIASALSHQDDTIGFVPGIGYEEGSMSLSTDAIIVDIEASLGCLYGEDVDLDWVQMLAQPSLSDGITLAVYCEDTLDPAICACEQSTYVAEVAGNIDCSGIAVMYCCSKAEIPHGALAESREYHPYLGSVEFITDMRGDPYQPVRRSLGDGGFFLNTIWGENLQNQRAYDYKSFSSRFRFNGKEWDDETGNFYYGARYYDPKISVWLSVDPLAHEMPAWSPYSFTFNNPIRYVDPDGRLPIIPWLLKATAGAAADMMAQASMDYLFNPNTSSWSQAFDNVNYYQVARSGAEGLIPWRPPGGRIGRAAGTALVDVLVNAANDPNGYTQEQAGMDFITGFIGDLAGGGFGSIINKYGSGAVINGLMGKLGYSATQIRKMTGGFDGESVRAWYKSKVDAMNLNVAPTEANARQVVNQRNMYKQQARDLMSDQNAAGNLPAIQGYDYYYQKYYDEGYRGEDLYNQIINAGGRTNPTYNQKFGE